MATESEKPISELTAGEAYLRFIACDSPDDSAYDATYERLHELLYGLATGYAWVVLGEGNKHHKELVENAVQNAFLKIVRQQRGDVSEHTGKQVGGGIWSPSGNKKGKVAKFETWFCQVVRSKVLDLLRKEKPQKKQEPESQLGSSGREQEGDSLTEQLIDPYSLLRPLDAVIKKEEAEALRDCVNELDETPRDVIHMAFWEGQNLREIAEDFGWLRDDQKTARTERVYRCLNEGQAKIEECMNGKGYRYLYAQNHKPETRTKK